MRCDCLSDDAPSHPAVYCSFVATPTTTDDWVYCGFVANEKPSGIFRLSRRGVPALFDASGAPLTTKALIGISIESFGALSELVQANESERPSLVSNNANVTVNNSIEFTEKLV